MDHELRESVAVLWKRRWIVLAAVIGCIAAASALTLRSEPVWEARAKILVGQQQLEATELAEGVQVTNLSFQLLKTYASLIRTRPVAEQAVERDSLRLSPTELVDGLNAQPVQDTQIIELSYRANDPTLAQRVVNAVAATFVEMRSEPAPGSERPAVEVSVVEPALQPESPVAPRPARNIVLATALGLLAGVGLAFAREYFDTSVSGPQDAERAAGVPVLVAVPRMRTEGAEVYLEREGQSAGAEAFRKLRTAIQFLGVDKEIKVVLVSSPYPQDGKTTTALNLAASYAQAGLDTILVEADLRRPTLHRIFPSDGQRGLTTALVGRVPLDRAVMPSGMRNLSYIPAGALPPNPTELLASSHMADVLAGLRARADVLVLDAPPLLPVADASVLASRADGVVVVARAGQTNRDRLKEACDLATKMGGRLLGIVLNGYESDGAGYGYGYGYRAQPGAFERREPEVEPVERPTARGAR